MTTDNQKAWHEKIQQMQKEFPSTIQLSWSSLLREDPQIIARLLSDIMKAETQTAGKRGKRPRISQAKAMEYISRMMDDSYAETDFYTIFASMTRGMTVRAIGEKCNLHPMYVNRLQNQKATPTLEVMEKIATAFDKKPEFFLEYRIYSVLNALGLFLENAPETATNLYVKLTGKSNG